MIPVHEFLDMEAPLFKGKSDFELWNMATDAIRFMIAIEYLGKVLDKSIENLGKNVGSAVIAVMQTKEKK